MKATLECLQCTAAQAVRAARIATDDPVIQRRILDEAVRRIPSMDINESPAVLSLCVYELTAALSGNPDPYRALKKSQNELALAMEPELRAIINQAENPLVAALHLAAAGNIIDLGVQQSQEVDVHGAIDQAFRESFAVDHTEALLASLENCSDLVYLLDNAGEIVFDKLLIELLVQRTKVTAVVKAGPMINDVLLEDAEQVGLTDLCEVIDNGGAFVGSPLNLVPDSFLHRLGRADVIIGKGQGNYETLDGYTGNVFLILRAKCPVIAADMGVEYGQVALISTRIRNQ